MLTGSPPRASPFQAAQFVFRRCSTYSVVAHVSLLILPPLLIALYSNLHRFALTSLVTPPAYVAALTTFTALYRLSPAHPLACYPGPTAAKISKLYHAFLSIGGRQHEYIKALHERHGDVVRIGTSRLPYVNMPLIPRNAGPNELSVRDASVIPVALGASGAAKGPRASTTPLTPAPESVSSDASAELWARLLDHKSMMMISLQNTTLHLQRRRPWLRAFTPSAVKGYEELVSARARLLVEGLEKQQGEVDMDL